jgi:hypothetical protein
MVGILRWLFPETAGYYVVQEVTYGDDTRPVSRYFFFPADQAGPMTSTDFCLLRVRNWESLGALLKTGASGVVTAIPMIARMCMGWSRSV